MSRQPQRWVPAGEPPPPINLHTLCMVQGCISPRQGAVLCLRHQCITGSSYCTHRPRHYVTPRNR